MILTVFRVENPSADLDHLQCRLVIAAEVWPMQMCWNVSLSTFLLPICYT